MPVTETKNELRQTLNEPKFYITLHPNFFPNRESFELGLITSWFKRNGRSERYSIKEVLKLSSEGRCYIPAHIETDGTDYEFISSQLIFIDVDDDKQVTDPSVVLEKLKDICAGLYFTSSHGIKGNRYRLAFVLDKTIRSTEIYRDVFKQLTKRLIKAGIPADTNIQNGLQRIRTATKGFILSNPDARLEIDEYIELARAEHQKELEARANKIIEFGERKDTFEYSFEELKERAAAIGYVDEYSEWEQLAYSLKSYVNEGFIDDSEGYEIFSILCGGNDETKYWEGLNEPSRITIGTFIYRSNLAGFKRNFKYYNAVSPKEFGKKEIERVKFEKYIPIEFSKSVLEANEKVLIKSPTGSGKTSSFISAAKEIAETKDKPSHYYLLAVPTIAITDQTSADNNILGIRGALDNLYKKIRAYSDSGQRVIVTTYDMAETTMNITKTINPFASFTLIIDEYHQFTHSFNYRKHAIASIHTLKERVKGYIGLSGTIDDILRSDFDKEYHVETKDSSSPCMVWGAITYQRKNEEETHLIQLIKQKAEKGKRLLVFIQSKDMIVRIQRTLSRQGIKAKTVTSDSKKNNPTYNVIVKQSAFPEGVQVVLSTTVLSDGVNIKNENIDYECIVVSSAQSPNFNPSIIRQMSNRFRNPYRAFYLFMQEAKKDVEYLFNIDQAHEFEKKLAQNAVDLLNEQFYGKHNSQLFRKARIEKRFGIDFNDEEIAEFNELQLRFNVSSEKNRFYSTFRKQFIIAVQLLMGKQAKDSIDISDHLANESIDLTELQEELIHLKSAENMSQKELESLIDVYYTPIVHQAFIDDNKTILDEFKKVSSKTHYAALKKLTAYADYQTCLTVIKKVTRPRDTQLFKRKIDSMLDIFFFEKINRMTPTKEAFLELKLHTGQILSKEQLEEIVKSVSKKFKRSKKVDVEYILQNYFEHHKIRSNKERFTILKVLTLEHILEEFELSYEQIYNVIQNVMQNEEPIKQKILNQNDFFDELKKG